MKKLKIIGFAILILIVIYVVWSPLTLTKFGDRTNPYHPDAALKEEIKAETAGMSAEEIRLYSIKKTAKRLSFTVKNNLANGKANCVGYAQMCAGISNYAFRTNGINASAKPVVGYVMFYGVNLCDILKWCMPNKRWKNFVKDHDFVEYHIDGKTIYADASLYDVFWKDCETTL
ncbi:MAG: hypothetical protein MJZ41_05565 [Bacteroidaceae bacterium]|nr:hypothetical protein [Bacteroidaceae bacterium]